jgi:hypothetical protein
MIDLSFFDDPGFIDAQKNKDPYIWKNLIKDVPSWQEVLNALNDDMLQDKEVGQRYNFKKLGFCLTSPTAFNHTSEILEEVNKRYGDVYTRIEDDGSFADTMEGFYKPPMVLCFISLNTVDASLIEHFDYANVLHWNIKGKTKYTVKGMTNTFDDVLDEGDMLFIPSQAMHLPQPLTPRAAISFVFGRKKQ